MAILVAMVGFDYQRILDGINFWRKTKPIEQIYLLFDEKNDAYGFISQKNVEDLKKALNFAGTEPLTARYNPQSYESTFGVLYKILKKEAEQGGKEVYIDSTSTAKEAYGAVVTVALMFNGVKLYVVPPKERDWYFPSPQSQGFNQWFDKVRLRGGALPQEIFLPGYRLTQPDKNELKIILQLMEHNGNSESLTDIISWCKANPHNPVVKNRYSRLIKKLEENGFVETEYATREKKITLTGFGMTLAKAVKAAK
jgi:predicted transcriptional regulator